ncbi:MAG: sulfotransferase domain-containing protein, partial [Winogradskyella sp.]|nr:sulfotransferase domain-containing protein [Winogradskyella sp.]
MSIVEFTQNCAPIVINSHPRSGTHLLIDFLRRNYSECAIKKTWNKSLDDLYFSIEGLLDTKAKIENVNSKGLRVLASCQAPIIKYHCYSESILKENFPDWMDYLATAKSIYVYRNLYEVLCSTYIYMQTFDNIGKGVTLSEFIRQRFAGSPNRVAFWVNEINRKRNQKNNLFLSYEEIIR